jgi:outer membrane protein assembly factor BamB
MRSKSAVGRSSRGGRGDKLVAIQSAAGANSTSAQIAWQAHKGIPDNPSALYYDGHVYLVKSGGIVSCFEAATGEEVYRKRVSLRGKISASPVVGGGKIYAASESGQIVVFRADSSGDVLAKGDLKERIMATPAMVDGKVYIRTDKHLYAFGR